MSAATPSLAIDRLAPVERLALGDGGSWVDVCPAFVRDLAQRADTSQDVTLHPGHGALVVMGGRSFSDRPNQRGHRSRRI